MGQRIGAGHVAGTNSLQHFAVLAREQLALGAAL
jgi:hypothetical protein